MNKSNLNNLSLTRPVVLIGMMGAGKTTVGHALAKLLGVSFFDSDKEIESETGLTVAQIFIRDGEAAFRRLERQAVTRLLGCGACVLSLGGGAFVDEQTRKQIKDKAFSVWLKVDKKILLDRALKTGSRPLLKGENPKEKLEKILAAREPVYAEADLTVRCDDRAVSENAQMVMAALRAAL